MNEFTKITQKLHQFSLKFYTNELIRGSILFLSFGILYLFFTLFVEYFLWLQPISRTLLFWIFIFVELFLLTKFILFPFFKIVGLKKGISFEEASKIIGNHFPEVEDKLLNILQLQQQSNQSDLLLASIDQKSAALQPIPFAKAIDYSKNKKYLKYILIPIFIWFLSSISGTNGALTKSLERVVNYKTVYTPPAPFSFLLISKNLQVVQGNDVTIAFKIVGSLLPDEVKIVFNDQQYFMQQSGNATFLYTFSDVKENIEFNLEANGVKSNSYQIDVINAPIINNIFLDISYPNYIGKKNETIQNAGNISVPEGTKINWKVSTSNTDKITFIENKQKSSFLKTTLDNFQFSKTISKSFNYQISSSNKNLSDFENLQFSVNVISDEFPTISVVSNIDSISRGTAQFAGQISDDYGFKKLQLVYYDEANSQIKKMIDIPISADNIQTFFYQFPNGINLAEGKNYELFFQIFDNDGVNGSKKSTSKVFQYRQKSSDEIEEELLIEQKNTIQNLEKSVQTQKKEQKQLETLQQDLQQKKNANWNDQKKIENFIKRQEQYKEMMQRQTDKLQENLDEKKEQNQSLQDKKEALKERIQELKNSEKQQKLLDEIQKMAEKLNKEDLVEKAKELAQQNKQQQRSLEKTLELVKRFYVEQKTMQIASKVEELSKKQEAIAKDSTNVNSKQKEIKKDFQEIEKELEEVKKDNEKLKDPMELPDVDDESDKINEELKNAEENLDKKESSKAKKNQQKSAQKMKEMSSKMQKSLMEMQGESMEENMDDLRKILENLVIFSLEQENLMKKFNQISTSHPDFGTALKMQNEIKKYFEHIDDSLYVLSMRVPTISTKIQNDLSTAHYNLDQSLDNFAENRFSQGISNQRYVMTATNNLSDYLSNVLNNMKQNMSMQMKQGKGKSSDFSLPDLIKKQEGLSKKMEDGMKKGDEKGKGNESGDEKGDQKNGQKNGQGEGNKNDDLNGELYKIFKQQTELRQQLQDAINENESDKPGGNNANKALKTMEELENEILEKGFNKEVLQKMQQLNYELLKLDKAALNQGKENNRKSNTNQIINERNNLKALEFKKQFYNQIEILNRQSLPLQQLYKNKVRTYFSEEKKQ
ncbi:DUF4175 family protein [Polaribacter gangjinensis]|uniref:Glutamyl-tRNA synthetase n=1 Tax=Polaribacter gangjinensis TaxID=574710 RepID=A0A2S7WD66_9FLAO|nr:DUF4175 family protein [Polaribacter gangjinensis]PQJ75527.1 hypothetical protein BTO13_09930 [Polaribacter gangjinensis]